MIMVMMVVLMMMMIFDILFDLTMDPISFSFFDFQLFLNIMSYVQSC